MLACELGITEILQYLEEELKYDPNIRNDNMSRAYDVALKNMNTGLMEYLEQNDKYTGPVLFKLEGTEGCEETCMICQENIKKDEIYCRCEHKHVVHKECCLLNENHNNRLPVSMDETVFNESNYKTNCLYCKNEMLNKSFKCL